MEDSQYSLGVVFVTGSCGTLGSNVVKFLLEQGHSSQDLFGFDIATKNYRYHGVTYINGDLGSKEDISSALDRAKPDVIINTASPSPIMASKKALDRCNILGVKNLIECAQERGIRVLVHTSSSEVAQESFHDLHLVKELPALERPVNCIDYAVSKSAGEKLVLQANQIKGLLTCAFRLATVIGEHDTLTMRHFVQMGRAGSSKFQIGNGRNLYDFIYVGNAAEAHITAARALLRTSRSRERVPKDKRIDGEAFNLTNDDPWPFWEAVRFISREIGYPVEEKDIWKVPIGVVVVLMTIFETIYWILTLGGKPETQLTMMLFTVQYRTFDVTKAKERLGYKPRVNMETGWRRGLKWYLEYEKQQNGDEKMK